jgi:hypothetical protein
VSLTSEAGDFEAGNKGSQNGCQNDQKKWGKNRGVGGFITVPSQKFAMSQSKLLLFTETTFPFGPLPDSVGVSFGCRADFKEIPLIFSQSFLSQVLL